MSNRKFAADDANLNVGAVITARSQKYSDINMLFAPKPGTGDVFLSRDAEAVKQSVRNLLLTNFNERPFQPWLGGNLRSVLFNLNDAFAKTEIHDTIKRTLENYEPRAKINSLNIRSRDEHYIDITLEILIVALQKVETINVVIERLR
jgi:phage baseplate assembly protein W